MEDAMKELCDRSGVDFYALLKKANDNYAGMVEYNAVPARLTAAEWNIVRAALEVAGGV